MKPVLPVINIRKGMVTPMAKMNVIFDRCKGCELCTTACPKQIVAIQHEKRNKEGVFTAYCTDDDACIGCAMCAMMCPDCAIVIESYSERIVFIGKGFNERQRGTR